MRNFVAAAMILGTSLVVSANDINVNVGSVRIQTPGLTVTFGSQDRRGYYWDGYDYRAPDYWRRHNGHKGEKYYTGHGDRGVPHQDGGHCPPGQAKKGRC